jgi:hypothetical protein
MYQIVRQLKSKEATTNCGAEFLGDNPQRESRLRRHTDSNPFPIVLAIAPTPTAIGFAIFNANLGTNRYEIFSAAWDFGTIYPKVRVRDPQFLWQDAYSRLRAVMRWQPNHLASSWPGLIHRPPAVQEGWALTIAGMIGYIAGRFRLRPLSICLWRAEQWKGIAPTYTTQEKFLRLFGSTAHEVSASHSLEIIEAIMLCEFWLTLYHRGKFTWQQQTRTMASR